MKRCLGFATLIPVAVVAVVAAGSEVLIAGTPAEGIPYVNTLTEEARLPALEAAHPEINFGALSRPLLADGVPGNAAAAGRALWRAAVTAVQDGSFDDRPLYWARLAVRAAMRSDPAVDPAPFEWWSRGLGDVNFDPDLPYRVLITGFDPFGLDAQPDQSNPSGLAVLALHGRILETARGPAQVQGVLVPVRFADFDLGLIESFLAPRLADDPPHLIMTISMGRDAFDLERFPGRRRSAAVPDNLDVLSGANEGNPLVPLLAGEALAGPEFLQFGLPAAAMTVVDQPFAVRDNRTVRTLERGELAAGSLTELAGMTAVAGSGGGYLSNEIAYRTLLLNQRSGTAVPMGHLHTPRLSGYDAQLERQMVDQIRRLIVAAVGALP
ncbi:MAG: hypothetical protein AB7I04_06955 [Pseudomonadales bacterium]